MLDVTVIPGHEFQDDIPFTTDDLNAAANPSIKLGGTVDGRLLADEAIQPRHVQPGAYFTITTTGTANAQVANLRPKPNSLAVGLWCSFFAGFTNTGPVTLKVGDLDAKPIKKNKDQALVGGDLRAGAAYWVQFDGTNWQLTSPPAVPQEAYSDDLGTANAYKVVLPWMEVADYSAIVGRAITFIAGNASTGASTFALNSLSPRNIVKNVGDPIGTGDIKQGQLVTLRFDGQDFQLALPMAPILPALGPGAGTYAYPASIGLDANGRVIALTPGSAPPPGPKAWGSFNPNVGTSTKSVSNSSASLDTLTVTAHGRVDGDLVWLDSGTIGGLATKVPYYVKKIDNDTIKLSTATNLSSIVDITANAATGSIRFWSSTPIVGSSNVQAVLWLATGDYWIQFTTALSDAYFAVIPSVHAQGSYPWVIDTPVVASRSTVGIELQMWDRKDGVQREADLVDFVVFR